ncbi:MAG: hypothetical protein ABI596_11560 [Pyrinomonadaceae bacterium]
MRKLTIIIGLTFLFAVGLFQGNSLADGSSGSRHRTQKRRAHATRINCLPPETKADEVISYGMNGRGNITVEKKLAQLKARCRNRKLVDAKGREIRFFKPSCWGNPPADYAEIQQRENEELEKLRKCYTVIVFGCNPMIQ